MGAAVSFDSEEDPPTQPSPGREEQLWLVSYSDDDDRELTTSEIVQALRREEITLYSLAWCEGMPEWQPIANIEALRAPAGLLIAPLLSEAPEAPPSSVEELDESEVLSSPPSRPPEGFLIGDAIPDSSLAPPLIDHAAFFIDTQAAELPGLPPGRRGAAAPSGAAVGASPGQPARRDGMAAPIRWVVLLAVALGAGIAGFMVAGGKKDEAAEAPPTVTAAKAPAEQKVEPAPVETAEPAAQPSAAPAEEPQGEPTAAPAAQNAPAPAVPSNPTTRPKAIAPPSAPAGPAAAPEPAAAPAPAPQPAVVKSNDPFDKNAAAAALNQAAASASSCRSEGDPSGIAQVSVTFTSSGRATRATVNGPPFQGTPTGSCIAQKMRQASVPPFKGDLVTVQKRVVIQ